MLLPSLCPGIEQCDSLTRYGIFSVNMRPFMGVAMLLTRTVFAMDPRPPSICAYLWALQCGHANAMFAISVWPPRDLGRIWSTSKPSTWSCAGS